VIFPPGAYQAAAAFAILPIFVAYLKKRMLVNRFRHSVTHSVLSALLLLVFLLLIYNKAVYTHVHLLADGTIVTHAHPYQKSDTSGPVTDHSHTKNTLFLLSPCQLLFCLIAVFILAVYQISYAYPEATDLAFHPVENDHRLKNKSPPFIL
jgi:amino acid transporter